MHRKIGIELLYETMAGLYMVAVVLFFWKSPVAASLFLSVGIGFCLWRFKDKADAAAMLAAAILGTPSEMICVKYGVWTYEAPGLIGGIPVWIPLIWASLFCLFRRITLTGLLIADRRWPLPDRIARKIVFGLLAGVILAYYLVVALTISKSIVIVYTVIMVIAFIFWNKERDILIFIIGGILGTFGEYICMQLGFWQYHFPHFRSIGLPISLPMAWGLSAVMIGRIAKTREATDTPPPESS
jgi:hypothetical protein